VSGPSGEDAGYYAEQLHLDCAAIATEAARIRSVLAQIADLLALSLDGERAFSVRQAGAWITREDRP